LVQVHEQQAGPELQARQILAKLLAGRITFTPGEDSEGRYYAFEGEGALGPYEPSTVGGDPGGIRLIL
jgi:hypothetical protein